MDFFLCHCFRHLHGRFCSRGRCCCWWWLSRVCDTTQIFWATKYRICCWFLLLWQLSGQNSRCPVVCPSSPRAASLGYKKNTQRITSINLLVKPRPVLFPKNRKTKGFFIIVVDLMTSLIHYPHFILFRWKYCFPLKMDEEVEVRPNHSPFANVQNSSFNKIPETQSKLNF